MTKYAADVDAPEIMASTCASCQAALTLVCEPTTGFWGYPTYNEYFCPRCSKRNVVRSSGAVLSSRLSESEAGSRPRQGAVNEGLNGG